MAERSATPEKDVLPTILNLLIKQQRVSENTSRLVESMVAEIGKFREHSERLAIVSNKLESLERIASEYDRRRIECLQHVAEQFRQAELKREQNKDRIAALEQEMGSAIPTLRNELQERIREQEKDLLEKIEARHQDATRETSRIREKIGFMAGKYGAVAAAAVSLAMMILKWIFDHQK